MTYLPDRARGTPNLTPGKGTHACTNYSHMHVHTKGHTPARSPERDLRTRLRATAHLPIPHTCCPGTCMVCVYVCERERARESVCVRAHTHTIPHTSCRAACVERACARARTQRLSVSQSACVPACVYACMCSRMRPRTQRVHARLCR